MKHEPITRHRTDDLLLDISANLPTHPLESLMTTRATKTSDQVDPLPSGAALMTKFAEGLQLLGTISKKGKYRLVRDGEVDVGADMDG